MIINIIKKQQQHKLINDDDDIDTYTWFIADFKYENGFNQSNISILNNIIINNKII